MQYKKIEGCAREDFVWETTVFAKRLTGAGMIWMWVSRLSALGLVLGLEQRIAMLKKLDNALQWEEARLDGVASDRAL
jgi:hypothetical protein